MNPEVSVKLEKFWLFHMRDFYLGYFFCALLTGFKWSGVQLEKKKGRLCSIQDITIVKSKCDVKVVKLVANVARQL